MKHASTLAAAGVAIGLAILTAPAAHAGTRWALTGSIGCGGSFDGTFTTDVSGRAVASDFVEVGGCTPGIYKSADFQAQYGYSPIYEVTTSGFNISSSIDGDNLFLRFVGPLIGTYGTVVDLIPTQDQGSFKLDGYADYIEITSGKAVALPEPGVWALLIGGFGLAGAALRRRRDEQFG